MAERARSGEPRALRAAWDRSDRLFSLVAPQALLSRPIPLRQPFLFYIGHLPAFAWNQLWRGVLGRPAFDEAKDALFERGIDPPDDADPSAQKPEAWPPVDAVLAYRDRVRAALGEVLEQPELQAVVAMVLEHELMHHETLLYMIQQLPAALKPHQDAPPRAKGTRPPHDAIAIPAGTARLGAPRNGAFRWDNEHPEHRVEVEAFSIDRYPVTNHDFLAFVEAGGYREPRFWSQDAWAWLTKRGLALPPFWRQAEAALRVATLLEDVPFEVAADWPACVSHCEASAYARWKGARLPSEPEFHRAAFATPGGGLREHPWGDEPPGPEHANLGFRCWEPMRVDAHPKGASAFGVEDLVGNGWEWTSSLFGPFPGFEPLERYPGYSADFFDGRHYVMLGGSWATDLRLVRRSLRNWFQPHYPYVFAKFRCVQAAG